MRAWARVSRGEKFTVTKGKGKSARSEERTHWSIDFVAFGVFRDSGHPDFFAPDGWEEWELADALHFVLCKKNEDPDKKLWDVRKLLKNFNKR